MKKKIITVLILLCLCYAPRPVSLSFSIFFKPELFIKIDNTLG